MSIMLSLKRVTFSHSRKQFDILRRTSVGHFLFHLQEFKTLKFLRRTIHFDLVDTEVLQLTVPAKVA